MKGSFGATCNIRKKMVDGYNIYMYVIIQQSVSNLYIL